MKNQDLDTLYEIASEKPGWLSKLESNMNLSSDDVSYLVWRDNNEAPIKEKLQEWEDQIIKECGLFDIDLSLSEKFSFLNSQISKIEREGDKWTGENRFLFLGLSPLDRLQSLRFQIKQLLLSQEIPNRKEIVTESELIHARSIPLERFIPNLPKHRKIKCPYHEDSTASFHVYHVGYCFGCGISVDSIRWGMDQLGLSFIQAVKALGVLGR